MYIQTTVVVDIVKAQTVILFDLLLGLQRHFRHLEAVALERETIEEYEDFTLPDMARIEKRVGTLLKEFNEVISSGGANSKPRQKRKVSFNCQMCYKFDQT